MIRPFFLLADTTHTLQRRPGAHARRRRGRSPTVAPKGRPDSPHLCPSLAQRAYLFPAPPHTHTHTHHRTRTLVYTVLRSLSTLSVVSGLRWREAATNRRRRRRPSAGARPSDAGSYCRRRPSSWREPHQHCPDRAAGDGGGRVRARPAILSTARARVLTSRVRGRPVGVEGSLTVFWCLRSMVRSWSCVVCAVCVRSVD